MNLHAGVGAGGTVVRLVLDTNVVLDCFGFMDQHSAPIVRSLECGEAQLCSTPAIYEELLRVLDYPRLSLSIEARHRTRARYEHLAFARAAAAIDEGAALRAGDEGHPPRCSLPSCSDVDDQKFLEAARDVRADFLITKDTALLKISRARLRARLPFRILSPASFPAGGGLVHNFGEDRVGSPC